MVPAWVRLLPRRELDLERTLTSGQSFRFAGADGKSGRGAASFSSVLATRDVVELAYVPGIGGEHDQWAAFRCLEGDEARAEAELHRLLQSHVALEPLELAFSAADARYASQRRRLGGHVGVRTLAVEPFEALISFVLSSVNNIPRISQIVERLAAQFEENLLLRVHVPPSDDAVGAGDAGEGADAGKTRLFYAFPRPEQLASLPETRLRKLGLGFRAPWVREAALRCAAQPGWLEALRAPHATHAAAREALIKLPGVGLKVADCVCMASLGHSGAVPVDTHAWQLVRRWYAPHLREATSITPRAYAEASGVLMARFGAEFAGWAFMGLFTAELSNFRKALLDECGSEECDAAGGVEAAGLRVCERAGASDHAPKRPRTAKYFSGDAVAEDALFDGNDSGTAIEAGAGGAPAGAAGDVGTGGEVATAVPPTPRVQRARRRARARAEREGVGGIACNESAAAEQGPEADEPPLAAAARRGRPRRHSAAARSMEQPGVVEAA